MGWIFGLILIIYFAVVILKIIKRQLYKKLEFEVLHELGFYDWNAVPYFDTSVTVKSRQALEKYDGLRFFKEIKRCLQKQRKSSSRKKI